MDLAVVVTVFIPLLLVELPDKTFVATLVLSTRYRPLYAWIGAGLAFGIQCAIAVAAGGLLSKLPSVAVSLAAGVLFAIGSILLWRGAGDADAEEAEVEEDFEAKAEQSAKGTGIKAIAACFLVIFVAEWGDLSQLFIAGFSAKTGSPVSVFIGAWAALLVVSGLAALLGRALLAKVRLSLVRRGAAIVCGLLAVLAFAEAAGADLPI